MSHGRNTLSRRLGNRMSSMTTAMITPSYAPDFERCKLLCSSVSENVLGLDKHYLIVDRTDEALFRQLQNHQTEVVLKEDLLPLWIRRIPFSRKWWLNLKGLPVRGWILQQLIKLSVAEWCEADNYLFADSDVLFIRPFSTELLHKDGTLRLFKSQRKEEDYGDQRHKNWYQSGKELFGLKGDDYLHGDYIGQLNTWRRDVLQEMYNYLCKRQGRDWISLLSNRLDFSEYILYGLFAEYVLGLDNSGHYLDSSEICYCSWHHKVRDNFELKSFLGQVPEDKSAVLIQSNLGFDAKDYKNNI
jgi:hypothetical protein